MGGAIGSHTGFIFLCLSPIFPFLKSAGAVGVREADVIFSLHCDDDFFQDVNKIAVFTRSGVY